MMTTLELIYMINVFWIIKFYMSEISSAVLLSLSHVELLVHVGSILDETDGDMIDDRDNQENGKKDFCPETIRAREIVNFCWLLSRWHRVEVQ